MIGKLISLLLMGYVGLMISVEVIPLITSIDISALEAESPIVFAIMGVALWLIPLAGVCLLIVYAANQLRGR